MDDYFRLEHTDFSKTKSLVFSGRSGSGKSTAIEFLLRKNLAFMSKRVEIFCPQLQKVDKIESETEIVVVDELRTPFHLLIVLRVLLKGKRLLLASHLPELLLVPLCLFGECKFYRTDRSIGKLRRFLMRREIRFEEKDLQQYVRAHGAVYTDLEIIIERGGDLPLGESLQKFYKLSSWNAIKQRKRILGFSSEHDR